MQFLKNMHERITGKKKILSEMNMLFRQQQQLNKKINKLEQSINKKILTYDADVLNHDTRVEIHLTRMLLENLLMSSYGQKLFNFDSSALQLTEVAEESAPLSEPHGFPPALLVRGRVKLAQQALLGNIKYVHIGQTSLFMNRFSDFINKNFNKSEHSLLILYDNVHHLSSIPSDMIPIDNDKSNKYLLKMIFQISKKIFIHGLYGVQFNFIKEFPEFWQKSYWIPWGGDIYITPSNEKREFVGKIAGVVTNTYYDYSVLCDRYQVHVPWISWGPFYNSGDASILHDNAIVSNNNCIRVLVGHSATITLKHAEVFQLIKERFFNKKIKVVSVLAYGDDAYRKNVIALGQEYFGENFEAVINMMPAVDYNKLLAGIDIAIFAQERQQALQNITTLLYFGKKVYVRKNTAQWEFIYSLGGVPHDMENLKIESYSEFVSNIHAEQNSSAMLKLEDGSIARFTWHDILSHPISDNLQIQQKTDEYYIQQRIQNILNGLYAQV